MRCISHPVAKDRREGWGTPRVGGGHDEVPRSYPLRQNKVQRMGHPPSLLFEAKRMRHAATESDSSRSKRKSGASRDEAPRLSGPKRYDTLSYGDRSLLLDSDRIGCLAVSGDLAKLLAEIDLTRTRDLLVGIHHQFVPLRQPSRGARNGEQNGEHVGLESHRLVNDPGVEIDVGIQLASDEIVVAQGDALEFERDVDAAVAAGDFKDLVGDFLDDAGAGIVVLVDAMPETHELDFAGLHPLDVVGNVGD